MDRPVPTDLADPAPRLSKGRAKTARPKSKTKSKRRKLYDLHTWVGFHLALLMFVILFTGTVATISNEIDWLIQHDMRVSPSAALSPGQTVSFSVMEAAVRAYVPDSTLQSIFQIGGDHFAYRATVMDEFGRRLFVHVDPWTGTVTGETHPLTVQRVFRDLHRYLFMPNVIGLPIVTSMGFILAVSLYTGLKTSRNWKTLLFRVRTDKGARIMIGDAHKAAGLWSIWFFVVMIVTGIWYLIEFGVQIGGEISNRNAATAPVSPAAIVAPVDPVLRVQPMGDLVDIALEAYPGLEVKTVSYPFRPTAKASVQGMIGNPLIRRRANQVQLEADTGDVATVQRSRDLNAYRYINEMADPLHFGFFGGLTTKLIWFLFGILMTGLSATGVWLTWKRLKTKAPTRTQFATVPVMMLSMFFCLGWYDRLQGPDIPRAETALTSAVTQQGITAELFHACYADGARLRARLSAEAGFIRDRTVSIEASGKVQTARTSHFGQTVSAILDSVDAQALSLTLGETGPRWIWDGVSASDADLTCPT